MSRGKKTFLVLLAALIAGAALVAGTCDLFTRIH